MHRYMTIYIVTAFVRMSICPCNLLCCCSTLFGQSGQHVPHTRNKDETTSDDDDDGCGDDDDEDDGDDDDDEDYDDRDGDGDGDGGYDCSGHHCESGCPASDDLG